MERQSSAEAGGSKRVKVHSAGCLRGGGRESQGFHWVVARVRSQGAFSAIGRSLDFSWGVGWGMGAFEVFEQEGDTIRFVPLRRSCGFRSRLSCGTSQGAWRLVRRLLQEPGVRISVGSIGGCVGPCTSAWLGS